MLFLLAVISSLLRFIFAQYLIIVLNVDNFMLGLETCYLEEKAKCCEILVCLVIEF